MASMQFSDLFGSVGNSFVETAKIIFFRMLPRGAQIQKVRREINGGVLKKFGKITGLEIDKENRTIHATLDLKGEKESIQVTLSDYQLNLDGKHPVFELGTIKMSREWLDTLIKTLAAKNIIPERIEIKNQLHKIVLETLLR
jgi:hypothetical protein